MKKPIWQDEYVVRLMFGCGHGHVMPPGFTHWESGEACPWDHSGEMTNEEAHLYGRLMLVPVETSGGGENMWAMLTEDPNRWSQLPLAPEGLREGARLDTRGDDGYLTLSQAKAAWMAQESEQ